MNDIKQLTRFVDLQSFKADDKAALIPLLEKYGVDVPTKKSCPSCWRDAAILALRKAKIEGANEINSVTEKPSGLPRLRGDAGRGVIFNGRFVSNDVMTEELAAWLEQTGFPKHLYENAG